MSRAEELTNEILELRTEVLQETDKSKKNELYEDILNKVADCFGEYDKIINDGANKLNELNEALYNLAKLSITDPKECRRMLRRVYKA